MKWLSVDPSHSTQFDNFLAAQLLIWWCWVLIIRFKAISVRLDLPTGTELGNKGIVIPILTIQNKFVDQSEPFHPPLGNRVYLFPINRHCYFLSKWQIMQWLSVETSNSMQFDTFLRKRWARRTKIILSQNNLCSLSD